MVWEKLLPEGIPAITLTTQLSLVVTKSMLLANWMSTKGRGEANLRWRVSCKKGRRGGHLKLAVRGEGSELSICNWLVIKSSSCRDIGLTK